MDSINDFKLLTIIIPTYNRCKQVEENINLILPQIVRNKDKVRLYISDNASSDGTNNMVKLYIEQHPDVLFYYCQPHNITASPNFNHAVHAVNSEYVYILGDDDYVAHNFVETVLKLIELYPSVGLFHFNYLVGGDNYKQCVLLNPNVEGNQIVEYETGKDFILEHLDGPSFISSVLFKREVWISGDQHVNDNYPGYVWLSILLNGALEEKTLYYSFPMLIQGCPIVSFYSSNWAWYYIMGQGSLFLELDTYKRGIYSNWQNKIFVKQKYKTLLTLAESAFFKNLYTDRYNNMKVHLKTNSSRFVFWLSIKIFPKLLTKYITIPIIKVLRTISNLI